MHLTLKHHKTGARSIAILIMLAAIFLSLTVGQTAEPLVLGIEESIAIAMEKNLGYRRSVNSEKAAGFNYISSRAQFRPRMSFDITTPDRTEATTEQFDFQSKLYQWIRSGSSRYQGQLNLEQRLPTDGRLTLTSFVNHRNQYNTFLNETSRSNEYKSYFYLEYWQPLFQTSYDKFSRDQSKLNWSKAREGLRKAETELMYNVTQAFLTLFQSEEAFRISVEQENLSQRAYEIAVTKREAGVGDELDVLFTQSELARNRVDTINKRSDRRGKAYSFKKLLDLDLDPPVELVVPSQSDIPVINLKEALEKAHENNTDLRQAELDLDLGRLDLSYQKKQGGVEANLYLYYNLDGTDPVLRESYQDPNRNTRFFFGFRLPLYDWDQKKARVSSSQIRLENSEIAYQQAIDQIEEDIRTSVAALEDNVQLVEQAGIGLEYSRRLYEQALVRYKIGQIAAYELLQAQVNLATARKIELDSRISQRLALSRLEQLTQTRWR
ncbi:TolC family protein [candidate division KSB1 bacterium]